MKRKDWKIKKLTKDIYGKKFKSKEAKIYMLRKLFLRKNSLLLKKNLDSNYFLYSGFLYDFLKKKNNYLNSYFLSIRINYDVYTPTFFFNKKLFNSELLFYKEMKNLELNYIFINKNYSNLKYLNGVKFIVNNNSDKLKKLLIKNEKEDIYCPVNLKYSENIFKNDNALSFFIAYNNNLTINLEIYKILIICYINNLLK